MNLRTPIGKFLKKLRIDNDENLKDMGSKISCSPMYLCNIENGKRSIPGNMVHLIVENYNLSDSQKQELEVAALYDPLKKIKVHQIFEMIETLKEKESDAGYVRALDDMYQFLRNEVIE